jgi:Uma2 family endonuclease
MTTPKVKPRLTYEDYLKTPDDERYELLDGELIMAPSPREVHQIISLNLSSLLHQFVRQQNLGRVFTAPYDVKLTDTDLVQPDILFVSNARSSIRTPNNIQGAPDLVVEILSPSTTKRDWNYKRALYARHGVTEYWLVDPEAHTVIVLRLNEGVYEVAGLYGEGSTLASPMLEGFTLEVDEIFPA